MKNIILKILFIIAILIVISEIKEEVTLGIILSKIISITYIGLFLKANNYFN